VQCLCCPWSAVAVRTFISSLLVQSFMLQDIMLVLARTCASNFVGSPAQGLIVDCANGVGAGKLQVLADRLAPGMAAELRNTSTEAGLNDACGADFLQKERRLPAGFQHVPAGARCAQFLP
jgi:hypothetical protein